MALILAGFLVVVAPEVISAALMRDRRHRPGQGHHYEQKHDSAHLSLQMVNDPMSSGIPSTYTPLY